MAKNINKDQFAQYMSRVGLRVSIIRKSQRLTQEDLAEIMGTTPNVISRLESVNTDVNPKVSTIYAVANALNVTVSQLLNVDEENIFEDLYKKS